MGNVDSSCKYDIYSLCNLIRDSVDIRDNMYIINEELDSYEFKPIVDLRTNIDVMPIQNVGGFNIGMTASSCISIIIYNYLLLKGLQSVIIPSKNFNYYTSIWKNRQLSNLNIYNILNDKLSLRDYLKSLKKFGICDEKKYSFQFETLKKHPNIECFIEGEQFKIDYFRVSKNISHIKYILSNDKMLLISISVFTNFLEKDVQTTGKLKKVNNTDSFIGLMSAIIVGYFEEEKLFLVRFSLGKYWGNKGYGYIHYDDIKFLINDIWIFEINFNTLLNHNTFIQNNHNLYNYQMYQMHQKNQNQAASMQNIINLNIGENEKESNNSNSKKTYMRIGGGIS